MTKKQKNKQFDLLQDQIKELDSKWKRALADYQNLEKRISSERDTLVKFMNATLIEKLLVIIDDLERAHTHIKDKGLTMIINKFRDLLSSEGLEEIEALDKEFNPNTMDCVDLVKGQNNQVLEVVQKGYQLNGQILRPVKVKVGKGGSTEH